MMRERNGEAVFSGSYNILIHYSSVGNLELVPRLHKTYFSSFFNSFVQMIYSTPVDALSAAKPHSNMNFNLLPGLRRPTDFSVSSILGNTETSTAGGMWPAGSRLPPGLSPLHSKLPDMLAAELMQQQLSSMRAGLQQQKNTQLSPSIESPSSTGSCPASAPNGGDSSDTAMVELESMDLWEQFHDIGTEMVITKCGR